MRASRLSTVLLVTGLLLGVAAVIALLLGADPTALPPFLVRVALYKLTFIAVAGLLAAGAFVGRWVRRERGSTATPSLPRPRWSTARDGAPRTEASVEPRETGDAN